MLQQKETSEVPTNFPGLYLNTFLVRKASGGWHPVIDLKQLNAHIDAPHFHMHTMNRVETGDYVFKIDLQDAYFHVLITSEQQEVPSFCLRKQGIRHKTQFNKWPIFSHQDKNYRRGPIVFNWVCSCKHIIKFVL